LLKVLVSNDDGVGAPGIKALYQEFHSVFKTTVVAPLSERSTTGHSLSLDAPLRIEQLEENIYGCSGFPADCVLLGVAHVLKEDRPHVVVSGINRGANLAQDMYYSGTIAAAREGAFHGYPALAVSLVFEKLTDPSQYESAARFVRRCLEEKIYEHCPKFTLININVPNLPYEQIKGCRFTEIGFRHYSEEVHAKIDARGREYFWIAGKYQGFRENLNSDCHAVHEGYISITPHSLVDGADKDFSSLKKIIGKLHAEFH